MWLCGICFWREGSVFVKIFHARATVRGEGVRGPNRSSLSFLLLFCFFLVFSCSSPPPSAFRSSLSYFHAFNTVGFLKWKRYVDPADLVAETDRGVQPSDAKIHGNFNSSGLVREKKEEKKE